MAPQPRARGHRPDHSGPGRDLQSGDELLSGDWSDFMDIIIIIIINWGIMGIIIMGTIVDAMASSSDGLGHVKLGPIGGAKARAETPRTPPPPATLARQCTPPQGGGAEGEGTPDRCGPSLGLPASRGGSGALRLTACSRAHQRWGQPSSIR
eukprot:CAMPEP_0181209568 /NCGR_PEP_ID=MMETSP1096-20121128/22739_1 /TAXON_ID=156174 ORGANISM="Chrysochromulina ericina, Strain CCMP281" /NCGR_SAMPLE_ID=MMETSP1096 /ASSEMBLY_ACC=CAM_ASM_000453 /LENGTH=151 /DNA_ID=CAMNT_0023300745 /DNA_START=99 /DNA_END=551 /DNA_ORIENTATION=+